MTNDKLWNSIDFILDSRFLRRKLLGYLRDWGVLKSRYSQGLR